jgi:8-oxo-dGTP pyrophosphatase MutT (NUDIX family)
MAFTFDTLQNELTALQRTGDTRKRGGIILLHENKVLLVKDTTTSKWSFPKGAMEDYDHDNPLNTAIRECREETGLEFEVDYTLTNYCPAVFFENQYYYFARLLRNTNTLSLKAEGETSTVQWVSLRSIHGMYDTLNSGVKAFVKQYHIGTLVL